MKVVILKSTGKPVYQSEPLYEKGYGIKNAVAIHGGKAADYAEVDMTDAEYQANPFVVAEREAAENEAKIIAKMREMAVRELIDEGELPADFEDKAIAG